MFKKAIFLSSSILLLSQLGISGAISSSGRTGSGDSLVCSIKSSSDTSNVGKSYRLALTGSRASLDIIENRDKITRIASQLSCYAEGDYHDYFPEEFKCLGIQNEEKIEITAKPIYEGESSNMLLIVNVEDILTGQSNALAIIGEKCESDWGTLGR